MTEGDIGRGLHGGEPDAHILTQVDGLCDAGAFAKAHRLLSKFAPLDSWRSVHSLCIGRRLAYHLGAHGLARRLALRAYRRDPRSAHARFWVGAAWFELRGPLAAWHWLGDYAPDADVDDEEQRYHCWLRAMLATEFRDFDVAHSWLDRADTHGIKDPHTEVLRLGVLSAADRYDEALEFARALVASQPGSRAGVRDLAELLQVHGKFDESCSVLRERVGDFESGALYLALAHVEFQLRHYPETLAALDRAEELLPLAEEPILQFLASARADALYFRGDTAGAIAAAQRASTPFQEQIANNLARSLQMKTVLLDVPFVRQHHLTCVPATLAALARFWRCSADHLAIADRICYDGTRAHASREWARQQGWEAREFTVTWDATVDLCDRGVPFIVDTIQATSAHAQAIVGYDLRRGTLFIRDPYLPTLVEVLAVQFFEQYAAHGPRGFAVVPAEQAARLHGLELPESELYANLERIEAALEVHDRASASAAASELQKQAPGHRLAILGRRALANYDENPFEQLAAADAGLVLFPGEPTWLLQRLSALRANSSSARVAQELEAIHADDSAHPVFRELLAAELSGDARELPRAMRLLRRVARQLRDRSATLTALAECHWTLREFEHSLGLYRLAATLDTTSERAATAFFRANLSLGRAPEGIRFLERRAEQSRKRSSSPDITLFCALEQTDQSVRAFEVLQMALAARPQDGALCRFAARAEARYGNLEHAQELLQRAEPVSPRSEWLRSVAEVAACAGDGDLALQSWREVATLEPLATDAHAAVAQRLLIGHGPDAARDYLVELAARFPENVALQTLLAEHLSGSDPNHALTALEHLVALEPAHAWAHRELALTLSKLKSFERARQHAQQALALEPSNPSGPLVLGRVAEFSGDREGARAQYQRAMQLDADSGLALSAVVGMLGGSGEVVALLEDCYDRVLRESRTGDGVFAWFSAALGHFEPIELARRAKNARIQRADLFASWCVGADTSYGTRPAAAVAVAKEMTERFPLLPGAWLGLARASDASGQESKSVAALERAIEINPAFLPPTLDLCTVLERRADMVGALHVLDRALRHAPLDVTLLVQKASLLKRVGRRDEALATLRSAIDADPRAPAPWELLTELADAATAVKLIANVLEHRAWDTDAWLRFAQAKAQNDVDGALVALDRAIELEPHRVEAHDLRVMIAARTGRRSQALEACRPEHFGEDVPAELRGREAWVWAQFGEVQRAIVLMDAVLEDYPDYAWGHQQLADWAEATDDGPRELRAAEALARLHARSAIARGYLASALEKAGKPRRARKEYRRALALMPTYQFAAMRLVELALERSDYAEARSVARAHADVSEPWVRAFFDVRLAVAKQKPRTALKALKRLAFDERAPLESFESALGRVHSLAASATRRMLDRWVLDSEAPSRLGASWAQARTRGALDIARVRRRNPAAAVEALRVTLDAVGDTGGIINALALILLHYRFIRRHHALWGTVGYVLTNASLWTIAAWWLRDYEQRSPDPWMLYNLAHALRARLCFGRALAAGEYALRLEPDHTTARHLTLVSLEYALRGQTADAEVGLREVVVPQLPAALAPTYQIAENVVNLSRAVDPAERAGFARAAWTHLDAIGSFNVFPDSWQWLRVAYRIAALTKAPSDMLRAGGRVALVLGAWLLAGWLLMQGGPAAILSAGMVLVLLWLLRRY